MMSQEEKVLRFVTWNTNGIRGSSNSSEKLSDVLRKLSKIKTDIAFIQETHIGPKCYDILKRVKGWKVFFTVHSSRSKGVAILIGDTAPFEYICHDEDYSGAYIVLFCRLYGELYTLVNVYKHKNDEQVLIRLKDYLMETARGVLVVGGDFNTVLHPFFDRKSAAFEIEHSPLRAMLEDFIVSLRLRDTWAYLHPTDEGFTRCQNESYSRIDMFFMPEDQMYRMIDTRIESSAISDHDLLVLELRAQPHATVVKKYNKKTPDRRPGKINGAEILNAIKALTEQRPVKKEVRKYKRQAFTMSEQLKEEFNHMMKHSAVPETFRKSHSSGGRHIFNVKYLILSQILAKRLTAFITPSFTRKRKEKLDVLLTVTFKKGSQQIHWPFLNDCLRKLKWIPSAAPPDFSFLCSLLPKGSTKNRRSLQNSCPLTKPILNLALKQLDLVLRKKSGCTTSVCYQRQVLHIHTHPNKSELRSLVTEFEKQSGISLEMLPNNSDTESDSDSDSDTDSDSDSYETSTLIPSSP